MLVVLAPLVGRVAHLSEPSPVMVALLVVVLAPLVVLVHCRSSSASTLTAGFDWPTSLMLQNTYFKCFRCFIGMLQVFHMNVAYVAMVIHVCCKLLFSMFHSDICCKCSYLDVAYVSRICRKCFIWMLRMFTMVSNVF
jgi:hypothetical protein